MARKLTASEMAAGGVKFVRYLLKGGLLSVNIEVTKRCNARCNFCDYWKEKPAPELEDYVPVVRRLQPLAVSLTGGEPLMRHDLPSVIASLRQNFGFLFIGLVTNGSLLSVEKGVELWNAGLDELSISLDYLDERHDRDRHLPGLASHVLSIAPGLRAAGVNLCFNIVIKSGNYKALTFLVETAARMGVKVSFSTYNPLKTGDNTHRADASDTQDLRRVIAEILRLRTRSGTIMTTEYYLGRVAQFFERGAVPGCSAGLNWLQVTPDGMIKRCPDHPAAAHFSEWTPGFFGRTDCERCWYSCRGAAQEPFTLKRFIAMARDAI
jgi:MoaA/NifB/PqqE/SkfB family radical SAM enzyme